MMEITRTLITEQIEKLLAGRISREDVGWWAYDLLLEKDITYEPGFARLLEDALRSLHYFHDDEPIMQQFYPDSDDLIYYLKCLKGEEMYQPSKVVHWKV